MLRRQPRQRQECSREETARRGPNGVEHGKLSVKNEKEKNDLTGLGQFMISTSHTEVLFGL